MVGAGKPCATTMTINDRIVHTLSITYHPIVVNFDKIVAPSLVQLDFEAQSAEHRARDKR